MTTNRGTTFLILAVAAACSEAPPRLPPVPLVEGPLRLQAVFPAPGATLPAFGTYTVYGSVGNGGATLTINGISVPVLPNGSFLGRIPVPKRDISRFDLVAVLKGDTSRQVIPVRILPAVDEVRASSASPAPEIEVANSGSQLAVLGTPPGEPEDPDRLILGTSAPGGAFRWFLVPGTRIPLTGAAGDFARVRLDSELEIWVKWRDIHSVESARGVTRRVFAPRIIPSLEWVDVAFPVSERPPFRVDEEEGGFVLTLYGAELDPITNPRTPTGVDPLIRAVEPEQVADDRVQYRISTADVPFGYSVLWREDALIFRLRRPPPIHWRRPLQGLTIALDPGHPPLGAVGPTGLSEAAVTLSVGLRAKRLLEERGATVIMTRATAAPVGLGARAEIARRGNAHALVSIHVDAMPGEMDPYVEAGTRTYFFHPHSGALAESVQRGVVKRMGLRDRGLGQRDLAMLRPTWMPAVLCEGAMLILPEEEAALRNSAVQAAYARGIADGVEEFFRSIR